MWRLCKLVIPIWYPRLTPVACSSSNPEIYKSTKNNTESDQATYYNLPAKSKGPQQNSAVRPSSKGACTNKLTGATTYKVAPHINCPRSAHWNPHQVPNTQCTTTNKPSHAIKIISPCHTIPGFPNISPQGPTWPLVHAYNSFSHAGTQLRNRGVTRIPPATVTSQVQKCLGRILLQLSRNTMPRHWYRGQRYQETEGSRNRKLPGYQIRGCTSRQTKVSNLYKGSVWGMPPERRPQ